MFLAMDVGNTNIVIGIYDKKQLLAHWRLSTDRFRTPDEYGLLLRQLLATCDIKAADLASVILGSVVPPLTNTILAAIKEYLQIPCLLVDHHTRTGLVIKVDHPEGVGADRIINGVAGLAKYGAPLIVVDMGTAITFDYFSAERAYIGGAIVPGMGIALEALFERAAKLPRVEIKAPARVVANNTVECMQSGLVFGYAALIDGLVEKMWQEKKQKTRVIATGGMAAIILPYCRTVEKADEMLTLDGLRMIYEQNT